MIASGFLEGVRCAVAVAVLGALTMVAVSATVAARVLGVGAMVAASATAAAATGDAPGAAPAGPPGKASAAPLIAAASDLRFALDEVAAQFTRETGKQLRIVYGSSGNFRRQIAEGGPYELFLSADESFVLALAKEGFLVDEGVPYATGRLALVVPDGSPLKLDPSLRDLAAAAADGRVKRFAIANPEHAPYGRAAQEALTAAGAWERLKGRLVLGENVAQAAQFAVSGSAQGGIVALSLALAPGALGGARHVAIPESMHQPLRQRMALTKRATETARAFYRYLQAPAARAVLQRYGFVVAGA
jgi:molybdate transport system substrate-binding protein